MPTNKNALLRYKYLDRLLSDHHHYYDIHDLTEKVNDMLYEDGFPEVTQRCIEKDLVNMQGLFSAPIEHLFRTGRLLVLCKKEPELYYHLQFISEFIRNFAQEKQKTRK